MKNLTAEDMVIALLVALFLRKSDRIQKAVEIWNECLVLLNNQIYKAIYSVLFTAYRRISDYKSAERYGRKLLVLYSESGDLVIEGDVSMALAEIVESQNRFTDAKQLYEKAIDRKRQTGEKLREASACARLGAMFYKLGENLKAKEYVERALAIRTENGNRRGEASCYQSLAALHQSLGECNKAKEYLHKALLITTEISDRKEEASCYGKLGYVCMSLGQYNKAEEYLQKALVIRTETGDRRGETCYINLGYVFVCRAIRQG